ncbi:MAG: SRPBCC family protein [Bacteroidota bacterium]
MEKRNDSAAESAPSVSGKGGLVIVRHFDAPQTLVWDAWTKPEHFMKWWGPKDFVCPTCKMDFRVGGKYLFCMRNNEGQEFWSTGVFREITPKTRLSFTDNFADEKGNIVPASQYGITGDWPKELLVIVTLEEVQSNPSKTKLTLQHIGIPAGEMGDMTNAGWNESFDKLAASLS